MQWLDEEGKPAVQSDTPLPGGSAQWLPGQVEFQTFFTSAPSEPGEYRLVTAVYDADDLDLPRLRMATAGTCWNWNKSPSSDRLHEQRSTPRRPLFAGAHPICYTQRICDRM